MRSFSVADLESIVGRGGERNGVNKGGGLFVCKMGWGGKAPYDPPLSLMANCCEPLGE